MGVSIMQMLELAEEGWGKIREVVRVPPEDGVTIKTEPWRQKVTESETDDMKSSRREREF